MFTITRYRLLLASLLISLLAACSGSDSTSVTADFSAQGIKGTVSGQNVTLDLSGLGNCATTIENMVVNVNASGYSISPEPTVARDYSQPVDFTITAPDGTKVVYTVTVKGAACNGGATPAPTACTAAAIGSTGYSLVFKGCDANNVATYYDKTECVRDNATGLIWQGQTPAGTGLRANDQYKSNFDSTTELQKWTGTFSGPGGVLDETRDFQAPTQAEVDASTNSIGFKNAVNASNLCGSGAWRLPTKDELQGIVKASEDPRIDNAWFPNTVDRVYWTSSPYVGYTYAAWTVNFGYGFAAGDYRDNGYGYVYHLVRLVR